MELRQFEFSHAEPLAPIAFVDLKAQYAELQREIDGAVQRVMRNSSFILGSEVEAFEQEFAEYIGVKHCIGVGSGLEALTLSLRALGIGEGDEVILPVNTFIATALAVVQVGATPVLVDHDPETYNISPARIAQAMSDKTKAIIPVHLYGQPADMDAIVAVAEEFNVYIVEDAAQAHGAKWRGRSCGSFGASSAFSFYPGKNLGAAGDAGAVVTNDASVAEQIRKLRNYGSSVKYHHELPGVNSRLDGLQAAILREKLRKLDGWNALRKQFAMMYDEVLDGLPVTLPAVSEEAESVYHLYVIQCEGRTGLSEAMKARRVETGIHYPIPLHRQPALTGRCRLASDMTSAEKTANKLLSLPMHPHLGLEGVSRVAGVMTAYFESQRYLASSPF